MTRIFGPKVEVLSAGRLQEFLDMRPMPNDRPLSDNRLRHLRTEFEGGRLHALLWSFAQLNGDSVKYRVNGKHTSHVLSNHPELWKDRNIKIVIEGFECANEREMAELYATYDSRASARTVNDVYHAMISSNPAFKGIPVRTLRQAIIGMALWMTRNEAGLYGSKDARERACGLLDEPAFGLWLHDMRQKRNTHEYYWIWRGGVVAAMYATWTKSHQAATTWWNVVIDGCDPDPASPSRILQKWLMQHAVGMGRGSSTGKPKVDTREVIAKCVHAWNADREGKSTDMKYYRNAPLPAAK